MLPKIEPMTASTSGATATTAKPVPLRQDARTIGLVVSDIRNPFFTTLSRAVEDAAYKANMRVVLCNTDENPSRETMYLRLMQEERVTGVIYAPTRETAAQLDRLIQAFLAHYADHVAVASRPYPGVVAALDRLDGNL